MADAVGADVDGTVTAGRKGIAYLRDHFAPEMSALVTERLERERERAVAGVGARSDGDVGGGQLQR